MDAAADAFPVFNEIRIHRERTLNTVLDGEFNALEEDVIG